MIKENKSLQISPHGPHFLGFIALSDLYCFAFVLPFILKAIRDGQRI